MTTQTTTTRRRRSSSIWTRPMAGLYTLDAAILAPSFPAEAIPENEDFCYGVFIQKADEGGWMVCAEDHEPDEVAEILDGPETYRTLAEAKVAGEDFARIFTDTLVEAWVEDGAPVAPFYSGYQARTEWVLA